MGAINESNTLEGYIIDRLEKAERANLDLEQLSREVNAENIRLREMLAAIGEKMYLTQSGNAIWMDSIMDYDSAFNRITKYFQLREKWEAKYHAEDNSD